MKKGFLFFLCAAVSAFSLFAQVPYSKVVMTVGGADVTAGELMRMYRKSTDPKDRMSLDNYLELFTVFKLKVADALAAGMDTTAKFKNELKGYRDQLARNYLTDTTARTVIYRDAYTRLQREVSAAHILIMCPPDASPADTLKKWIKADSIAKAARSGSVFRELATAFSEDPSVRVNGGELGYFTAFQMIAPFENAAFSALKGEIKGPVRTPYGYHIIKVNDIRPASGKVHTAHIFIMVPQGAGESGAMAAKQKADSVYSLLKSGADFAELAKKYSEHRETADKGGELNWFGTGEIIGEIAEPAFALKNIGDITEPVRSPFGWHIIKLLERKAPPSFSEARGYIESRINQDLIDKKAGESFTKRLKKEYRYRENINTYTSILGKCDSSVIAGKKQLSLSDDGKYIIYFADRKISGAMFAEYVNKSMEREPRQSPEVFLRQKLDRFAALKLYEYENSLLETKYSDFRYLVKEFHDGILMFELTSAKVWEKAKTDTAGLKNYWKNEWKGDASMPFDQVKDELIAGYQDYLEKEWISQLKKSYAVKTNSKVLDMLRKESENE